MAIDQLFERHSVSQSRLWDRRDSAMVAMETVLHLQLFSVWLHHSRQVLELPILFLNAYMLGELVPREVRVQSHVRWQVFRLLPAERHCKAGVRALVNLLQVSLLVRHILEVGYVCGLRKIASALTRLAESHLV